MNAESIAVMLEKAKKVMQHSYSPYSQYPVGACLKSDNEQYFVGTNIENAAFGLSTCAEASAISAMVSAGCYKIHEILIVAAKDALCSPCGACRQRIQEFALEETKIHLCSQQGLQQTLTINDLLPYSFSVRNLKHLSLKIGGKK